MGLKKMLRRWLEIDTPAPTVTFEPSYPVSDADVDQMKTFAKKFASGGAIAAQPTPVILTNEQVLPKDKAAKLGDALAIMDAMGRTIEPRPTVRNHGAAARPLHRPRNIDTPARIVDPSDTAALLGSIKR